MAMPQKSFGVSQFKEHDYRLVFFWSLDLGVQTPEDGRTGQREDGLSAMGPAADLMTEFLCSNVAMDSVSGDHGKS
ncbi:hypothetical protein EYF80_021033 [Liparis tanakae]|uniref:Uncharacterized protein n=1 Tax=Liparis tanakae TaxID=230148 RepID=A0A4Z2HT46_9TELE|nr:hypothetical protein EYF80_021033 [Liparis tanakae]